MQHWIHLLLPIALRSTRNSTKTVIFGKNNSKENVKVTC